MAGPPRYFPCPYCSFSLMDDGSMPGQIAQCPQCGGQFQMPGGAQTRPQSHAYADRSSNVRRRPIQKSISTVVGGAGCVVLATFCLTCGILGLTVENRNLSHVEVIGSTAELPVDVTTGSEVDLVAYRVAEAVYDIANQHRNVERVIITLSIPKSELVDRYGHPPADDLLMGSIEVDQNELNEVRKYRDSNAYAGDEIQRLRYFLDIERMEGNHLLKRTDFPNPF